MSTNRNGAALGALAFAVFVLQVSIASAADVKCRLTPDDKAANAKLSFDDFDQKGVTPSTWRKLEEAGCHLLAAEAADDYLAKGPVQTANHKSDTLFHEAQSLAFAGDDVNAARLVAAAIPPGRDTHGDLDWTSYLVGTWAFLVKDKPALDAAAAKMATEPGDPNRLDGGILLGLSRCFDKPYPAAYDTCRPKK
jgi:hypothetical protein